MAHDLVIIGGRLVDGTGAPSALADIAVDGDRITAIVAPGSLRGQGREEIDADGLVVTPGFVDIHTHLDAQLAWDPAATSSCWHGVTTVVLGNCGVTFAPVKPQDRRYLAELMESVEDIPADSIMSGLPWTWESYGEYLAALDLLPKGVNVGGMVGHCAVRYYAMGERSLDEAPASGDDIAAMCDLVDEAMGSGALGFSTSRTFLHRVPDGRPVPGTFATVEEMLAIGNVLGRRRRGVFEVAPRLGERDSERYPNTREEIAWMGEVSRRTGRPVTFGFGQSYRRPDLYERVLEFVDHEVQAGARLRPQTTARGIGILFGLSNRTPFDRNPAWRDLRDLDLAARLAVLGDPGRCSQLVAEAEAQLAAAPEGLDFAAVFVLNASTELGARYVYEPSDSVAAHAQRAGVSIPDLFVRQALATGGQALWNYPFLNQSYSAVETLITHPQMLIGLGDSGAHVGQIMDASLPTFFLAHWVRDRQRFTLEAGIRKLSGETAEVFGISDRGVARPGAYADLNVLDLEALSLPTPMYVKDFPGGAGRYIAKSTGYLATIVNGQVFMREGEHTGAVAGRVVRSVAEA